MKTTLEENRQKKQKETVNVLQNIVEKNYDAEKGYAKAMQEAKNPALKGFLKQQALKRSRFATEIDKELRQLGAVPKDSGSIAGKIHRTWIDIRSSLAGNDDEAVLEEVIRGEKASVKEYKEVLQKHTLAPKINTLLQSQMGDIQGTLNNVKRLEDITS